MSLFVGNFEMKAFKFFWDIIANDYHYRLVIVNFIQLELVNVNTNEMWLEKDDDICHADHVTLSTLNK